MIKEEKKLFPAQEKSELVLDVIRKHWYTYVPFWFLATIMLIPVIIGAYYLFVNLDSISPSWINIIIILVSVYLLILQALLIFGFVDFYLDVYIITDRRIVDIAQNGLFKRSIAELNLAQIQDVNATVEGFAATLLHFGDVQIQSAAERPNFIFRSIPHPYEISKKILDLHEAYLRHLEQKGKKLQREGVVKAEEIMATETIESPKKIEEKNKNNAIDKNLDKTLTEKWFDDRSEECYSDESCRQKLLEGVNKHLEEEKLVAKDKTPEKEGEMKEGKEIDL